MKCKNPQCNNILPDNALYCPVCGKKQFSTKCKVNFCSVYPSVVKPNEKVLLKWEGENVKSIKVEDTEYTASSKIYLYPSASREYKIDFISEEGEICSKSVYVQVKGNSTKKIIIVSVLIIALVASIILFFINSSVVKTNIAEIVEVVVEKEENIVQSLEVEETAEVADLIVEETVADLIVEEVAKYELSRLNYEKNVKTYKIDPSKKEFVDLGLPSGTLWATCNIGATKPEEFGNYFAWGEVAPKFYYDTLTYKWWYDDTYTKYSNSGDTLELSDDVAYVNWGDSCSIPSRTEIKELSIYTICKFHTINGVDGYELTSKMNGNTIFFPKTGYMYGKSYHSGNEYWTNSINDYNNNYYSAYCFYFKEDYYTKEKHISLSSSKRYYGLPIRPVKRKK